ncbi:uncharacterized protein LOC133209776 [Neopsephotus bourkii]|uniref:uncharacterized protein LOC133209776 n=1 Tax=Neopsephotus bourkii TaxID=309878 RepID=UPI002AA59928|nr:uncharacterized protein LOC133209776 [Neopsephotus bourkii]
MSSGDGHHVHVWAAACPSVSALLVAIYQEAFPEHESKPGGATKFFGFDQDLEVSGFSSVPGYKPKRGEGGTAASEGEGCADHEGGVEPRPSKNSSRSSRKFYHLHWSVKDVTERALHEALKRSKLPGFSGLAVQEIINQVLEKLEESQVPVTDYALKSSGAAVIPEYTSPSFWNMADKVILYSLPAVDYVRSPELILEVGAPRNRKTKGWVGGGGCTHAAESCVYPYLCSSKLAFPVTFLYGPTHCLPAEHFLCQTASGPPFEPALLEGPTLCWQALLALILGTHPAACLHSASAVLKGSCDMWILNNCCSVWYWLSEDAVVSSIELNAREEKTTHLFSSFQNELSGFVNYILLQVLSNGGHPDYTCIYRFRVHGDPVQGGTLI